MGSATEASPATTRPSSRPSWARRSSLATSRTSDGRRTEWSSRMPSSHTGYHTASATRSMSRRPLVDEDHVEVAVGTQLAPPVAAHGDEGDSLGIAVGRPVEQAGQPLVGGRREGGAEGVALEVGLRQQLLAQRAERHGRR